MLIRSNVLLCLLIVICSTVVAQNTPEVTRERVFTGKALYGFMNGGSDLYYEYEFEQLIAREITYMGEQFTVDIYQMATPEGAFGIYSIHTFRCLRADSLAYFDCRSKYQLQAVYGNEYISVVFLSGSEAAEQAADQLMRFYATKVEDEHIVHIPQQLSEISKPYSGVLKLLKGPLAISNVYPDFLPLVEGMKGYSIWFVEKENRALFILANNEDATSLTSKVLATKILQSGNHFVLFRLE